MVWPSIDKQLLQSQTKPRYWSNSLVTAELAGRQLVNDWSTTGPQSTIGPRSTAGPRLRLVHSQQLVHGLQLVHGQLIPDLLVNSKREIYSSDFVFIVLTKHNSGTTQVCTNIYAVEIDQ